jgi:hypothetical protein
MRNKANFSKSQMFVTQVLTSNCNEKLKLDTWLKQTQTKPILGSAVLCLRQVYPQNAMAGPPSGETSPLGG